MENKQTAVEWLYQTLLYEPPNMLIYDVILKKAKAMERDQIEQAHEDAFIRMNMAFRAAHRAEDYYDEVYGAQK
jgi:uncharacterized Fe-S cluster-containing MiaB family protein